MKLTRTLLEKAMWYSNLTSKQDELLGLKKERKYISKYLLTNPEISEETYQKLLSLRPKYSVNKRIKYSQGKLNAEICKYDAKKKSERTVVTWRFCPFSTVASTIYGKHLSVKDVGWTINPGRQLLTVKYNFANYALICIFNHKEETVRIEKLGESRVFISEVNEHDFVEEVLKYFPKKLVVKIKK